MVPRDPKPPRALTVRPAFEPHRLAPIWLADAYERLVPTPRRATRLRRPAPGHPATSVAPPREGKTA
jgi:hypothetical protein